MKIHNYGSDYAFQQKQKQQEKVQAHEPIHEPEVQVEETIQNEEAANEGDTVSDGSEGDVAGEEAAENMGFKEKRKKYKAKKAEA